MDIVEPVKRLAGKATGIGIPSREGALACVQNIHPSRMRNHERALKSNEFAAVLAHSRALGGSLRDRAVGSAEAPACAGSSPFGLPSLPRRSRKRSQNLLPSSCAAIAVSKVRVPAGSAATG